MVRPSACSEARDHIGSLFDIPTLVKSICVFQRGSLLQGIAGGLEDAERVLVAVELGQGDYLDMLGVQVGLGLGENVVGGLEDLVVIVDGGPLQ